ncbi:hypothetical protein Tco_0437948 [Tanacetum coccineum]
MQDFISINDFGDLNNDMLYDVQEIFHRLHQGPGVDDIARTFNSFLLVEVNKRNLNPIKQMRVNSLCGFIPPRNHSLAEDSLTPTPSEFFEDQRSLHFNLCSGSATEEKCQKKEFQFSLASNAKLNNDDLLHEAEQNVFASRRFIRDSEVMEGLYECEALESNVRRIQVKDIVKEVEDYLKTYSSAEMDISWYVEGIR